MSPVTCHEYCLLFYFNLLEEFYGNQLTCKCQSDWLAIIIGGQSCNINLTDVFYSIMCATDVIVNWELTSADG